MNTGETPFDPLDVAALARLANELFKGLPVESAAANAAAPSRPQVDPVRSATSPPLNVPPQQLDSSALAGLHLPHVYGDAAQIPHIASRGADPSAVPVSRADQPAYYFVPTERVLPATLDAYHIKQDFPILRETVNGRPLVWLDNAATTQKPQVVLDRLTQFYSHENSNIHRAAHELAARATDAYENARTTVQAFLGARSSNEIVFVRGATEAINLVAQSWGRQHIEAGDEIIVSLLEHHANIVPWKRLADEVGATLKVIPVDDRGQLLLDEYAAAAVAAHQAGVRDAGFERAGHRHAGERDHQAGACGRRTRADRRRAVGAAHAHQCGGSRCGLVRVLRAQGVRAHGIGVLYGKEDLLNTTQPWQGGGNMIEDVTFENIRYQNAPSRFEAGTGNIADAAGLAAALEYVQRIGLPAIAAHEHQLLEYGTHLLQDIPGLRFIGTAQEKAGVLSFVIDGCNPVGHRQGTEPGRHRGTRRASLRAAHPAPLWSRGHGPSVVGAVQHHGRSGCAGRLRCGAWPPAVVQLPGRWVALSI